MVDARAVFCELIRGNRVSRHVVRIRVATSAGVRDIDWVHSRSWVAWRFDIMHAVAIDAHRNLGVTDRPSLAMDTRSVLGQLIGSQAGVELANVCRIGMAASAQLGNLLALNLPLPSSLTAHRLLLIIAGWIAPMTTDAGQTFLSVNVLAEFLLSDSQGFRQGRVTIQAGVRRLPITNTCNQHREPEQDQTAGRR